MICQNDQVFLCGFRDEWVIAAPAVILIVQLAITDIGNSINCWDRCWLLCGGGGGGEGGCRSGGSSRGLDSDLISRLFSHCHGALATL